MKILFINPPSEFTVAENPGEEGEDFLNAEDYGTFPPLGVLSVLTHAKVHTSGHYFYFLECVGERISHAGLKQRVEEIRPDVVGITSFTISLVDVCMAAETVRAVVPDAHICLGGHHPIAFPFETAALPQFDSFVVGEGEVAFTQLIGALERGEDFTNIRGLYTAASIERYRNQPFQSKEFLTRVSVPPAYIDDLDSLPIVDRSYIRHIRYQNVLGVTKNLATLLSSRGCPYRCTFCDVPYKRYRERSVDMVLDEVEACQAMGYREFRFYDDLFNINEKKILNFCDRIEQRGMNFVWDFRGRVNGVTYESLRRARECGLRMISFGVETGTDSGLKELKKATTVDKVQKAFQWCKELGILTVADYIIGLPFEKTIDDVQRNIDFLIDLDPDYAQFSVLTLYPNTELYDQAIARGVIHGDRWNHWIVDPKPGFVVDHWEEHLSLATLVKIQAQAYRRFYFRPRYILRSAWRTRSLTELFSKFRGAMKLLPLNRRLA
jgi:anaerobic magnesium-protoporphyrin IX monomethyl ester cyclase